MAKRHPRWGSWADRPAPIKPEEVKRTFETEVLVVGAGIAGMSCALSAAEAGAKVTVLEKSSNYSARGFNIGVVNSSLMKERGYYNDPDEVAREWIKRCGNRCDERIVRVFVTRSPEAMDWLLGIVTKPEYGVRPELQGCLYKGETYREIIGSHLFYEGPIARTGKFGGMNDVLESMLMESRKYGVEYIFNTPMEQLIVEEGCVVAQSMTNGRISSTTVPLDSVAWTDYAGGQYVGTEDIYNGGEDGLDTRSAGDISQRTGESGRAVSEGSEGARGERGGQAQTGRGLRETDAGGQRGQVREIDAQELFRVAKPGQTVRTRSEPTERTSNAFRIAEKNGVKDFITFENEIETTTSEKSIRAYCNPATGQIGVQDNNPYVESEDLARHEIMEMKLENGQVSVKGILENAAARPGMSMAKLNAAASIYYETWAKKMGELTDAQARELFEHAKKELVCDGADHINQLRPLVDRGYSEYAAQAAILDEVLDALNGAANELTGGAFELEGELTESKNAAPEKGGETALGETRFSSKITPSQKRILDLDIAWDPDENSSIKEQLLQHIDEVKNMEPATSVNYDRKTSAPYYKVLDDILKDRFGYKISREDGISFLFDSKAIKSIRQYIESDAEAAAAIAAPYVVKRGKIISGHKHHKGGLYPSITIAAPAALNNNTGITAVTILFADKDRVHSLRVLTPDGKEFELQKNEADPKTSGDLAKARQTISDESASKKTIPQPGESVKTDFSSQLDADYSMLDPEVLEQQNEQLRKDLQAATAALAKAQNKAAYWEAQTKPSAAPSPDATDINRFAKYLVSTNATNLKAKDIAPALTELGEYIMRGGNAQDELTFTGVKERAVDIAHNILQNYSELQDSTALSDYKEIRKHIRDWGTIRVPGNDLPPDFKDWKAAHRWLRVAVSTGTDIDMVYKDLSTSWPYKANKKASLPSLGERLFAHAPH